MEIIGYVNGKGEPTGTGKGCAQGPFSMLPCPGISGRNAIGWASFIHVVGIQGGRGDLHPVFLPDPDGHMRAGQGEPRADLPVPVI